MPILRILAGGAALVACGIGAVVCTPQLPTSAGNDEFSIELSIGRRGIEEAEFWGQPLVLIIRFEDSVRYGDFHINKGAAQEIPPDISRDQKFRTIHIPLYWAKEIPQAMDSTDTIFVMSGVAKSNEVFVRVMNRAPLIDSLIIADTALAVKNDVFGDRVYAFECDTQSVIGLRVYATDRDFRDRHSLDISWRSRDSVRIKHDPIEDSKAFYETPETNFRDTVIVIVSDGKYDVKTHCILSRTTGSSAILFDSLVVDSAVYDTVPEHVDYEVVTFDSARIDAYVRGFGVRLSWEAGRGVIEPDESADAFSAVYRCTLGVCGDTLEGDTTEPIDTIVVTARDRMGMTLKRSIGVVRVPANRRPVIDSVRIGRTARFVPGDSLPRYVGAGETLDCVLYFHDPDGDTGGFDIQWGAASGAVFDSLAPDSMRYTVPDALAEDTLRVSVADPKGFVRTAAVALEIVTPPAASDIAIGHSVMSASAEMAYNMTIGDTLALTARLADSTANATLQWRNTGPGALDVRSDSSARYASIDSAYSDTVTLRVVDTHGVASAYRLRVNVTNRRPVMDSIAVNDQALDGVDGAYSFAATVLDTLALFARASDPDGETPTLSWTTANADNQGRLPNAFRGSATYICQDSLYRDTVIVAATDSTGAAARALIIVKVDNRYPVIDSMRAGQTVFRADGATRGYGYTAPAGSKIPLEVYAHDPDENDQFSILWEVGGGAQTARRLENAVLFTYQASDAAYADTAAVTVTDRRNRTDVKMFYLTITKKP
jgi:hypothetical protein